MSSNSLWFAFLVTTHTHPQLPYVSTSASSTCFDASYRWNYQAKHIFYCLVYFILNLQGFPHLPLMDICDVFIFFSLYTDIFTLRACQVTSVMFDFCNSMDWCPLGFSIHGFSRQNTEGGCHSPPGIFPTAESNSTSF